MVSKKRTNAVLTEKPSTIQPTVAAEELSFATADSVLKSNVLRSAIHTLLEDTEKHEQKRVKRAHAKGKTVGDIMSSEIYVNLAVTFKEAPFKGKLRPHAIPLKHSLHTEGEDEVCLFVKDPQRLVKDYLAKHGNGGVTRVLGIEKLRKRYKTFEGKRELLQMYDHFLVDNRIAPMLPRLLGNVFLKTKRIPMTVNMQNDIVNSIKKTLSSTSFTPRQGTSTSIRLAKVDFSEDQVYENLMCVVDGMIKRLPRGWNCIQSLNLKSNKSPALPIYMTMPTAAPTSSKVSQDVTAQMKKKEKSKEETVGDDEDVKDGEDEIMESVPALDGEDDSDAEEIEDDEDDDDKGDEEVIRRKTNEKDEKQASKENMKKTKKTTPNKQKATEDDKVLRRTNPKRGKSLSNVVNEAAVKAVTRSKTQASKVKVSDDKKITSHELETPKKLKATPRMKKKSSSPIEEVKSAVRRSARKKSVRQLNNENVAPSSAGRTSSRRISRKAAS